MSIRTLALSIFTLAASGHTAQIQAQEAIQPATASAVARTNSGGDAADSAVDSLSGGAAKSPRDCVTEGLEIHLRLLEPVASNTHKPGDRFKMEVAEAALADDRECIASGSYAEGEVIHADKPKMGGRSGELILAARFVRIGGSDVKLSSFTAGTGTNRYDLAMGLGVTLGFPALFVKGKNIIVPSGTDVYAKVAAVEPRAE